jgi:predicted transcriptional regulator
MEEVLQNREQELADERKSREAEREQYQGNQQALLLRIEALEKASRPVTPDDVQAAEARAVKLASWMRLKR